MDHECVILADNSGALVELCGISILERLLRTLPRCGITHATVLSSVPAIAEQLAQPSWARDQLQLTVREQPNEMITAEKMIDLVPASAQLFLIVRGNSVFDARLLSRLTEQTSATALMDSGKFCGAALLPRDWMTTQNGPFEKAIMDGLDKDAIVSLDVTDEPPYHPALRRKLRPYWFSAPPPAEKKQAERILLDSVQKGSQDLPAYVHAPIEKFLVSYLCWTPIKPNQITVVWAIMALATTVLFATGFLIWGIALAFIIGILDGLDGKQARLKVETTKGGKLEHQVDTFLEVAWPTALAYHFYASGELPQAFWYLALLLAAEALDGIGKLGVYVPSEKSKIEPGLLDQIVRLFGGRRNIYIWVLIVCIIAGVPARALIVMAWWETATAIVDLAHAGWKFRRRKSLPAI
jgi:phosphatidylglycerophosphate synthase